MDKVDLLYDHYKETVSLSLDMQKKRGNLFVLFCVFEILNFLMLLFPNEITNSFSAFVLEQYKVTYSFGISVIQTALWLAITYVMVRYYQTNIYIERQYGYIAILEDKIAKIIKEPCFKRESENYLSKYPKVLDLISVFYTWVIPLAIIFINLMKIVFEWIGHQELFWISLNSICFAFCLILSLLYLHMMHSGKHS